MKSASALYCLAALAACGGKTAAPPLDSVPAEDTLAAADVVADSSADAPDVPAALPLAAVATCSAATVCAELAVEATVAAAYRKDFFLPDADYHEYTEEPLHGGRFHLAAIAGVAGQVTKVLLNGVDMQDLETQKPGVEWHHVWPQTLVQGEALWLAFHSRDPAWDQPGKIGHVRIETTGGVAVDADFPVQVTPMPLTWVTTDAAMQTLLLHVHNDDKVPHTLQRLVLNGREQKAFCAPEMTVQPGQSALWTVPLCKPWQSGQPWTLRVDYLDAPSAVAVGRAIPPHFAVETWPSSADCVTPGGQKPANFQKHLDAGFDTGYWYWGNDKCGVQFADLANGLTGSAGDWQTLIGDDFPLDGSTKLPKNAAISGFLIGDESDAQLWDKNGKNQYEAKAATAEKLWNLYPQWPVYNGGMTNGNMGAFAGVADIQGIDFYVAACAPHVTDFGSPPPVRGAYDYLRNTRNNHMPLATWQYAQGLSPGWNKGGGSGGGPVIHSQPDSGEVWIQAISVMAAGGKGLMWFQTNMQEANDVPESWQAIADVNWVFRGVRELLREGDLTGQAHAGEKLVLAESIRSRRAIVVPVLNFATANVVDDLLCVTSFVTDQKAPHWLFAQVQTDVVVEIPKEMAIVEVFEVQPHHTTSAPVTLDVAKREITLSQVQLDEAQPARIFVLATDKEIRQEVEKAMK